MKSRIYLIRHGQYKHEVTADKMAVEEGLTTLGRAQAAWAARWLDKTRAVVEIHCSDMVRAWQTADICGGVLGLPLQVNPLLREVLPDGSSMVDVIKVYDAFFNHGKPGAVALVCHGNLIRYLLVHALAMPEGRVLSLASDYGSITAFDLLESGPVLRFYNLNRYSCHADLV